MRYALTAALVAALALAAPAWAEETITATAPNRFADAVTTIDQGEKVVFRNVDVAGHDVTAADVGPDDKPLFATDLIGPGGSGPVRGTEYLTTGTYPFVCTIHPGMEATLEVTSAGKPVPRPGKELSVRIASKKLAKVVKRGKLAVVVSSTGPAKVRLVATGRGRKLGGATVKLAKAGSKRVALALTKSGRRALKGAKRAKVAVTASADGTRAKAARTLR